MQLRSVYIYAAIVCVLGIGFLSHVEPTEAAVTTKGITTSGLAGWWTFDEGTSTIAHDFSGNGINATLTNGPTWIAGIRGKSVNMDGSNDSVVTSNISSIPTNGPATVSGWFYPTQTAIERGSAIYYFKDLYQHPLNNMLYLANGADYFSVSAPLTKNRWHHILYTYNGTHENDVLYLDGVRYTITIQTAGQNHSSLSPLYIGADGGGGNTFAGKIDDVRVYNRVLSGTEIAALYRSGEVVRKNVSANGLVGHWTFDEGTSTIAHDFSGNGNNNFGTLSGFALTGATSNWSTAGKRGGSLDFDGSNDQVYGSIPASTFSGDFTIAAWFNHRAMTQWGAIFSNSVGTNETAIMTMRDTTTQMGIMRVGILDSGVFVDLGADHYGKWIYGVITRQGSNLSVYAYKDGQLISSTGALSWTLNTDNEFYIGRHYGSGVHIFNGKIDDVRVYNRALSLGEIGTLYSQGSVTINHPQNDKLTNGLTGLWSFNGSDMTWSSGSTGIVYDRSGSGANATLVNMNQATSPVSGRMGQAMNFTGATSTYAQAGGVSSIGTVNQPYTISTWVKPSTASQTSDVVHVSSALDGTGWCISMVMLNAGKARAYSWTGGPSIVTGSTSITPDAWYHIVHEWDATNGLRLFVNGVLDASTPQATYSASGVANYVALGSPVFGTSCTGDAGVGFNGSMDDTRIYNRALSAAEVKQLYLMGK